MHALDLGRVDEGLDPRPGFRQLGQVRGVELERDIGFGLAGLVALVVIGAQNRIDYAIESAQHAVRIQAGDSLQGGLDRLNAGTLGLGRARPIRIQAQAEQADDATDQLRLLGQPVTDIHRRERQLGL